SQSEGRANRLYQSDAAGLGRLLCARSAGRSRRRMDLGSQSATYSPFAADSGISEANGAVDVSRGGDERAAMERLLLLSRRVYALVGTALRGRKLPTDHDTVPRPDGFGRR